MAAGQHSLPLEEGTIREIQSVKILPNKDLSQCRFQRQLNEEMGLWGHQEEFVFYPFGCTFREGVRTFF